MIGGLNLDFLKPHDGKYIFLGVVDKHAPFLENRVKYAKQPVWFPEDIKHAMFLHDTYASTNDEEK